MLNWTLTQIKQVDPGPVQRETGSVFVCYCSVCGQMKVDGSLSWPLKGAVEKQIRRFQFRGGGCWSSLACFMLCFTPERAVWKQIKPNEGVTFICVPLPFQTSPGGEPGVKATFMLIVWLTVCCLCCPSIQCWLPACFSVCFRMLLLCQECWPPQHAFYLFRAPPGLTVFAGCVVDSSDYFYLFFLKFVYPQLFEIKL